MEKEFTSHFEKSEVINLAKHLFIHKDLAPGEALYQAEKFKREAGLYMLGRGEYAKKREGGE